jgi:metallo-beta-lactamase class B
MKRILVLSLFLMAVIIGNVFSQEWGKIKISDDIFLIHLQDSVFIHQTWDTAAGYGRFSSNGLIIIHKGKAIMVDTPMDNLKTEVLTRYVKDVFSADLTKLIIGHFHDDCLGGLDYIQQQGIESVAGNLTVAQCEKLGLAIPSTGFDKEFFINLNGLPVECRFSGPGHSFDNITVWLPAQKILFGGCLVKSSDSGNLGNLSDAVVDQWDTTIKALMSRYPGVKTVVPGHGNHGGSELLTHTIMLVEKHKKINCNF